MTGIFQSYLGTSISANTNGSLAFNGVDQYLTGTGSSALTLDGDFTIELWINCGAQSNSFPTLIAQNGPWSSNATQLYICASHLGALNVISLYNDTLGGDLLNGTTTVTDSLWHHVAVVRASDVITLYVDGIANGTYTNNFTVDYSNFAIGSNPSDGGASTQDLAYQGLLTNLRIVKGIAVYTANFTPSNTDLPATQSSNAYGLPSAAISGTETGLLLNTYSGIGFLQDHSTYGIMITNNSGVISRPFYPWPISDGLVLYLDAGNYAGSGTNWPAQVGPDATLYNAPTWINTGPSYFNFTPASLQYADTPNYGSLASWTVECWFQITADYSTQSYPALVTTVYNDNGMQYDVINYTLSTFPDSTTLTAGYFNQAWFNTAGFATTQGVWYQMVGTYGNGMLSLYINGSLNNAVAAANIPSANGGPTRIARRWDGDLEATYFMPAEIGIVKVYDQALTSVQVQQNFNAVAGRFAI